MFKKYSRRDLLKYFGVGALSALSPVEIFFESLLEGVLLKAHAEETKKLSNKYILVQEYGAPPRWMYDLFLKPYGGDIVPNASVASEFSGANRYTEAIYKTHKVKGIEAPIMWTHDVSNGYGDKRPLSDLMDNMLVLQGIDSLNPGHVPATGFLNRPLTQYSLDGMLADYSENPFGSLAFGTSYLEYKSAKGKSLQNYGAAANLVKLIPEAFNSNLTDIHKKYKGQIDRAIASLSRRTSRSNLGGVSLGMSRASAEKLIQGELENLSKEYPKILKKYEKIISETVAMSQNLKGLSDKPVGKSSSRVGDLKYRYGIKNKENLVLDNKDLRTMMTRVNIPYFAKNFAMAEYVILNNLTSSVSLNAKYLGGLTLSNGKTATLTNDQHYWGVMPSLLFTTVYFRIISASILSLVDALKSKSYKNSNMFNHTVIRQTGEFGRHPRDDGSGSDHSSWSSNTMLVSGMLKGPVIAGEILKDGASFDKRKGSWGAAGKLKNGEVATMGHVVSTIASMLDIPSPSSNRASLVVKEPSGEVSLNQGYIDKTKVV